MDDHFLFTSLHPLKKPQKKLGDWAWRTRSYLAVPPSAATSETSRSSGSLVDWGCKFYVWTSVPALAPVLHTTAGSSKTAAFHYLIISFAINNVNSWNPLESLKVFFFFFPLLVLRFSEPPEVFQYEEILGYFFLWKRKEILAWIRWVP